MVCAFDEFACRTIWNDSLNRGFVMGLFYFRVAKGAKVVKAR